MARRTWLVSAAAVAWAELVAGRLRREYAAAGTFSPGTVALLYSAYAVHGLAVASAVSAPVGRSPLTRRPARMTGGALLALGAGVAAAGMGRFGSAAQISGTDAGELVTTGPYRFTRNPQYLGLVAGLLGIAVASRSVPAAVLAAAGWSTLNRWIPSEESRLTEVFGDRYRSYARTVPRWI